MSLEQLPSPILDEVICCLDYDNIITLCDVNMYFRQLCNDLRFWEHLLSVRYPLSYKIYKQNLSISPKTLFRIWNKGYTFAYIVNQRAWKLEQRQVIGFITGFVSYLVGGLRVLDGLGRYIRYPEDKDMVDKLIEPYIMPGVTFKEDAIRMINANGYKNVIKVCGKYFKNVSWGFISGLKLIIDMYLKCDVEFIYGTILHDL